MKYTTIESVSNIMMENFHRFQNDGDKGGNIDFIFTLYLDDLYFSVEGIVNIQTSPD